MGVLFDMGKKRIWHLLYEIDSLPFDSFDLPIQQRQKRHHHHNPNPIQQRHHQRHHISIHHFLNPFTASPADLLSA